MSAGDSPATCFLAVAFASAEAAEDAEDRLRERKDDLALRDVAIVVRTQQGPIEVKQTRGGAAGDAMVGVGTAGLVAGILLGLPIAGALVGLLGGGVWGLRDTGIPDSRMRKLGDDLQPGHAVLCVLVDEDATAPAREVLSGYGTVTEVALSSDAAP